MGPGIITRYSASAGSGKTYELAAIYLKALFSNPLDYRHILAVTFTNKASAEMKERILNNLYLLSRGEKSEYSDLIVKTSGKSHDKIRSEAGYILNQLLHDYSRFSVGTIDSFFQKVLRSFARESGLQAGFNIILDSTMILMLAVDELLRDAEEDRTLLNWLIEFGQREVMEGKSWNLKSKILALGYEIFREKYRLLHDEGYINEDKEQLGKTIKKLYEWQAQFRKELAEHAGKVIDLLDLYSVEDEMLYGKSRSMRRFLEIAVNDIPVTWLNPVNAAYDEGKYNSGKGMAEELEAALEAGLDTALNDMMEIYRANIKLYRSVRLILDNLYTLGILNDIATRTRKILGEQNKFLLSDAGDILKRIIGMDQAPFIYEKTGNRYTNYMIDEFQDTSRVQWLNFLPLIRNSIAEGNSNLVVGDIKQSIYRWRNSDWEIFANIQNEFHPGSFDSRVLGKNWRSCPGIISFNNKVFSELPSIIEEDLKLENTLISDVYADVIQEDPGRYTGGYVRMKLYDSDENAKEDALEDLPALLEEIQDKGYLPGDIGILVRTRNEGQEVIDRITSYASDMAVADTNYSYRVISQDSLLLSSSPVVIFLVSVLRYLVDREDEINRAVMYQNYLLAISDDVVERPLFLNREKEEIRGGNGTDLDSFLETIRYLSVFEMLDSIIAFTGLNRIEAAIPYLNTLQNSVLEFAGTETNDIPAFLEWWDKEGRRHPVSSTEQSDAMQLMTIHKAKGLQFKVVVLPFISWKFSHELNPVLWIHSDRKPLSGLGAVPVRMKKDFEDTFFEHFYYEELGKAAVDKLNLLYVAFTRAQECLYGNLLPSNKGKGSGAYLHDLITGEGRALKEHWDEANKVFTYGRVPPREKEAAGRSHGPVIKYGLAVSEARLSLRLHSKAYYSDMKASGEERRQYGLLMHEILSSIRTVNDVDDAINYYLRKGIINEEEKTLIREVITGAIRSDEVKDWFSENVKVRNEKDILMPGGDIKRPDRIVFKDNTTIVIDFKFGEEMPDHKKQISKYRDILLEMGYENVEARLWYVEESRLVKV